MDRMLPFLITGVALLVGWVVFAAVRSYRNTRQALRDAVRDLGFTPAEPDPALLARLAGLYTRDGKRASQDYRLENVFRKPIGDAEMFVFDLVDTSGDENTQTEQQAIAVVSPRLSIPPFVVTPKMGSGSALAPLANRMLSWVARNYGSPVDLAADPVFSKHYLVSSREPDAARHFLTTDRTRRIAEVLYTGMHAGGDIFTVSTFPMGRPSVRRKLSERVDHASRIFSVFGAS